MFQNTREAIDGEFGWCVPFALSAAELARVRELITEQWLRRLADAAGDHLDLFAQAGLAGYHRHAELIDHAALWTKSARLFSSEAVAELREMSLLKFLEVEFGPYQITDEEQYGREEIYWRLVRPHAAGDVGPLHADSWFWKLGDWKIPPGVRRLKLWVAVECEPGKNGLSVLSGSHLQQFPYRGEFRDGKWKPRLEADASRLPLELVPTRPGDAVLFHDDLLHGGALNQGDTTRVSFECTLLVPE